MTQIHESPKVHADLLRLLDTVSRTHAGSDQPVTTFRALDEALASIPGHKLFTILSYDRIAGKSTRLYSNLPDSYPAGGRKKLVPGPWSETVLDRGDAYIGRTQEDLRAVFADHELIATLDCQSVINLPVRWRGVTWGSLNLLHAEDWYSEDDIALIRPFAQLALPALLAPRHTLTQYGNRHGKYPVPERPPA
jgi:hypothetical protein